MGSFSLLEKEKLLRELQPHPISFFSFHILWITLLVWGITIGIIFMSGLLNELPEDSSLKDGLEVFIWLCGLLVCGVIASLVMIRWRILIIYLTVFSLGVGLLWMTDAWAYSETIIPFYTIGISFIGLFFVELYRKSHNYYITDLRLVIKGGMIIRRERTLRYDKISDIDYQQSIVGRLFRFGHIIPVTQSGFGLGNDATFAAGGVEAKTKKRFGIFGFAGGKKELQTPRARTYYKIHGAHPFNEIKELMESLVQKSTIAPYQQEQVELQREMVGILRKQAKPDTAGDTTQDENQGEGLNWLF